MSIDFQAPVFTGVGRPLEIQTLSLPDSPGRDEVLVELVAAGACHSDLHVIEGEWATPSPVVLGHEGAGRVVAVGQDVTRVAEGDHVIVSWTPSCGKCGYCTSGRPVLCRVAHETAYASVSRDGGTRLRHGDEPVHSYLGAGTFGKYALVAETAAVKVREDAPFEQAALVGCAVATGIGAATNTARVRPGQTVLVIGCGGVGLNVIQGARLAGAGKIIAVDAAAPKLGLAERFGATHTVNAREVDTVEAALELTGGVGVDVAFEVIGLQATIETAFRTTGPGGTTVLVGQVADGVTITVDPFLISNEEKRIIGSNYGSCVPSIDFPRILDLYVEGRINLDDLITSRIDVGGIDAAFDQMRRGEGIRAVISH